MVVSVEDGASRSLERVFCRRGTLENARGLTVSGAETMADYPTRPARSSLADNALESGDRLTMRCACP